MSTEPSSRDSFSRQGHARASAQGVAVALLLMVALGTAHVVTSFSGHAPKSTLLRVAAEPKPVTVAGTPSGSPSVASPAITPLTPLTAKPPAATARRASVPSPQVHVVHAKQPAEPDPTGEPSATPEPTPEPTPDNRAFVVVVNTVARPVQVRVNGIRILVPPSATSPRVRVPAAAPELAGSLDNADVGYSEEPYCPNGQSGPDFVHPGATFVLTVVPLVAVCGDGPWLVLGFEGIGAGAPPAG